MDVDPSIDASCIEKIFAIALIHPSSWIWEDRGCCAWCLQITFRRPIIQALLLTLLMTLRLSPNGDFFLFPSSSLLADACARNNLFHQQLHPNSLDRETQLAQERKFLYLCISLQNFGQSQLRPQEPQVITLEMYSLIRSPLAYSRDISASPTVHRNLPRSQPLLTSLIK